LSGFFTLVKDLLHTSSGVGAGDIFSVDHVSHQVLEVRLGIFNEIFVANPQDRHLAEVGVTHGILEPLGVKNRAVSDPPVPPLRVLLLIVEGSFGGVTRCGH
jgi:hypothetical protein